MYITEEQKQQREDIFLEIIAELTEELYDVSDDHEASEEDLYMTSLIMEHFVENLKVPTLNESIYWATSGIDPNQELYEDIVEALLDEGIGSMVAGAVHGISGMAANIGKKMAQRRAASLKQKAGVAKEKATAAAKQAKASAKGTGIIGAVKAGFHQAKAQKLAQKAQAATTKASVAATNRDAAANKAKAVQTRRSRLASKIDTGISNIKSRVKSAITGGAAKLGAAAGRMA